MPYVHPAFDINVRMHQRSFAPLGFSPSDFRAVQRKSAAAIGKVIRQKHLPRMKKELPRVSGRLRRSLRAKTFTRGKSNIGVELRADRKVLTRPGSGEYGGFIEWGLHTEGPRGALNVFDYFRRYLQAYHRNIANDPDVRAAMKAAISTQFERVLERRSRRFARSAGISQSLARLLLLQSMGLIR